MKPSMIPSSVIRHRSSSSSRAKVRRWWVFTRLGWLALLTASFVGASSRAATNNFMVINTNPSGAGSLSNAIALANASAATVTNFIQFAIPPLDSNTVHTITLPSSSSFPPPLAPITRRVIIDGYTQPGASSNTNAIGDNAKILIRIDASAYNGGLFGPILQLNSGSDGSTVRGLCIVEAAKNDTIISISSQSNTISGNFLGVDTDGVTLSSSGYVVQVLAGMSANIIGGTSPGARNVMASGASGGGGFTALIYNRGDKTVVQGNYLGVNATGTAALGSCPRSIHISAGNGVVVGGTNSGAGNVINAGNVAVVVANEDLSIPINPVIQGNLIGTDATGTTALRTLTYGVQLQNSTGTLIGGTNAGAGNVISSAGDGIFIANSPTGALIQGNKIGTDITGTLALGNTACGIEVFGNNTSTTNGTIGGTGPGQGNIIAFNSLNGISIASGNTGWSILGNSIHDNGRLGITLAGCGATTPTTNDACGTLTNGANHVQMFPVITGVTLNGGNITLSGTLNSVSNTLYRLEFFSNPSCDPRGFGQGQFFLGSTNVTTDASCSANFALTLPNPSGFDNFTATATDPNGNTSEFSACANASGPCAIICPTNMVVATSASQCGATVFFTATTSGNCGAVTSTPPSGSFFPKGTNTVICSSGGGTNCSFTIAVLDTVPPTIVCPGNIVTNVPVGQSNAVVNYTTFFSDNCGLASSNSSPPSGSVFPLGVTTVACTAADTSGNTNFCTFTVTVANTNMPPVARCQSVTTNANASCQANVPASAVDNGSSDPDGTIVSRTLSPPGPYPKGTNNVTLTVVDNLGASNSCTTAIIVLDTTPPTIACPANIVTNAPPGQSSVVVTYPLPAVTDNCAVASTNSSPPSGSAFPLGTTTVSCTATDSSGNTNTCSFTVTVNPSSDHFWTNALGGNYQNAANWLGHLVPAAGDTAYFTSNASYTISWTSNAVARNAFFHANNGTVTQAIGAFSWLVTNSCDIGTNNTATNIVVQTSGTLFVTNAEGVGELTVGQYGNGAYQLLGTNTSAVVDYLFGGGAAANVVIRGGAALRANQQILLGGFTLQNGDGLLAADPGSTVTTEILALAGVSRLVISNGAKVSGPETYIGGDNGGNPYNTNNLAIVTGAGSLLLAGDIYIGDTFGFSTDNALIVSNSATVSGETLTVGARNNRFVVDGGSLHITNFFPGSVVTLVGSGTNQLNHSGLIETDNLLLTNAAGALQFNGGTLSLGAATVANGQPFTVGNGSDPATLNLVRGSSVSFSNGLTLGNLATLTGNGRVGGTLLAQSGSTIAPGGSISKIVLSNSPSLQGTLLMEISKSGTTLTNDRLQVLGPLTYGGALTVSNLGPDTLALGDRFQLFIATNYAGTFSSLSLPSLASGLGWTNQLLVDGSLQVVTNTMPIALCRDVITNAQAGCIADVPPAAVDNGSFSPAGTIVSRTLSPAGPYPKGTNAVTLTVVNNQGGSNSCTASIIVLDSPPTIACPANIVTNAPHGQTSVVVNYPAPSVTDNCSGVTTNSSPPSGSAFPLGTTVVTCTATNASGATNGCSFTVTVNPTTQTLTWSGASTNGFWTNAANWVGNLPPANGDSLIFPTNATRFVNTNTLGGPTSLGFLSLNGSGYVLVSPPLTLTGGLTNNSILFGSNRLAAAISLGADQTWALAPVAGKNTLVLASNVTLSTFKLTLALLTDTLKLEGNVSGSVGSQLKNLAGFLQLFGAANSVPDMRVAGGTLYVEGALSGGLSISNGATLQGSGTVPPFVCAGTVRPSGLNPGSLTVSAGTAVFNPGSTFEVFMSGSSSPGTDYDQLKVSSPPNLSGASLDAAVSYQPAVGEKWVIITNTGPAPFTSIFAGLPEGAIFIGGNQPQKQISYVGGNGNDVVLTHVVALTIESVPTNSVRLLWPTNGSSGFKLVSSTNILSTNWTLVSPPPTVIGSLNNVVTNAISQPQMFYRLKQ